MNKESPFNHFFTLLWGSQVNFNSPEFYFSCLDKSFYLSSRVIFLDAVLNKIFFKLCRYCLDYDRVLD